MLVWTICVMVKRQRTLFAVVRGGNRPQKEFGLETDQFSRTVLRMAMCFVRFFPWVPRGSKGSKGPKCAVASGEREDYANVSLDQRMPGEDQTIRACGLTLLLSVDYSNHRRGGGGSGAGGLGGSGGRRGWGVGGSFLRVVSSLKLSRVAYVWKHLVVGPNLPKLSIVCCFRKTAISWEKGRFWKRLMAMNKTHVCLVSEVQISPKKRQLRAALVWKGGQAL